MSRSRPIRRALAAAAFAAALALAGAAFADVPISESARTHFKAGVNLLQDPGGARYEDAYREFQTAYADSPSPRILGNIGLCAMKLERDGEAIQAYDGYLAGVPDLGAEERRQITTDLGTLRAGAAHVALTFNQPGVSVVDARLAVQGGNVTNVYGPVAGTTLELTVRPGHHALTVKLSGFASQTFELEAAPGAKSEHTFTLEAPIAAPTTSTPATETPRDVERVRPIPVYVWIGAGVTGALAAGGIVTGSLALKKNSDFKTANDGSNPSKATDLRSSGQTFNVLTDVLFGTAIVGASVTTYLYVSRPAVESPRASGASTASFVRLQIRPLSAGVEGAF